MKKEEIDQLVSESFEREQMLKNFGICTLRLSSI